MATLTQQELDTLLKDVICVYVPDSEAFLSKDEFLTKYKTPIETLGIYEVDIPYETLIYVTYPEPRNYFVKMGVFTPLWFYRTKGELKNAIESLYKQIPSPGDSRDGFIRIKRRKACRKANLDFRLNIDFKRIKRIIK